MRKSEDGKEYPYPWCREEPAGARLSRGAGKVVPEPRRGRRE